MHRGDFGSQRGCAKAQIRVNPTNRNFLVCSQGIRIISLVVERESGQRNWKRLCDTEPGFLKRRPCEAMNCGHGGSRRPANRPPRIRAVKRPQMTIGVRFAVSDGPNREERFLRHAARRVQRVRQHAGNCRQSGRDPRNRTRDNETHGRPVGSPLRHPIGCVAAASSVAANRLYGSAAHCPAMLSGPRRAQAQSRSSIESVRDQIANARPHRKAD
jgi:hypothetical protein